METTVYIIRHGETAGNVAGKFIGSSDIPLSETGMKQIAALGKRFSSIELDAVYSSPYIRARATAEAVVGKRDIPIICDKDFCEGDCGKWEGHTGEELEAIYPGQTGLWATAPHLVRMDGGETFDQTRERVSRGFFRMVNSNRGKKIALTAHMLSNHLIMCELLGVPTCDCWTIPKAPNTGVTTVKVYDGGKFEIVQYCDISHLSPEEIARLAPMSAAALFASHGDGENNAAEHKERAGSAEVSELDRKYFGVRFCPRLL